MAQKQEILQEMSAIVEENKRKEKMYYHLQYGFLDIKDDHIPDDDDPSRDTIPPDEDDDIDSQFSECQLLNVFGDTKISNQELEKYGRVRVKVGVNSYLIEPVSNIPLISSDDYESSHHRTETGEIIPRYTKRYRENFSINPDGYYVKKDPTRNWELKDGILGAIPF